MERLNKLVDKSMSAGLVSCILSGKKNKLGSTDKVKIRQIILKDRHMFQVTEYAGTKVFHQNLDASAAKEYVRDKLLTEFKQCQLQCTEYSATVLVSGKGQITIKEKGAKLTLDNAALNHNRTKEYLLKEGVAVPFLVDLGVMTDEGRIVKSKYDKFRQINRFLEFIRDILPSLKKDREITILDFGCGKSYLTFAMYYYLKELNGFDINVTGLDLKADVIEKCNGLALKYGYDKLHFLCGDVADYEGVSNVDMVVTLHACDTATDYALAKAVRWGASVILSVPCCQHEFNKTMSNDLLKPVFSYGIIKERTAALMTDGIRACLLNAAGYETQILEFIDMEHTPKNLLIRAVKSRSDKYKNNQCSSNTEFDNDKKIDNSSMKNFHNDKNAGNSSLKLSHNDTNIENSSLKLSYNDKNAGNSSLVTSHNYNSAASSCLQECIDIMREFNVNSTLYNLLFDNEGRSVSNENN